MDPHRKVQRKAEANILLENELIREAFTALERHYTQTWQTTRPEDLEQREDAYYQLRALRDFKHHFTTIINGGTLAEDKLKRE